MKKCLLAIGFNFLIVLSLTAQTEAEKKIKLEIWGNAPAEFKTLNVPEKWKNESAVVLALHRDYIGDLTTKMTGLSLSRFYIEKVSVHFRIKLLDKAAVTDFSEIAFNNKTVRTNLFGKASAYRMIAIKVIKPNGTEKEVDLSKAVKTDSGSDKDLKIPVPNLEIGDIIDYFVAFRDESLNMPDFGDEILLEGKYPIVTNIIRYSIPHQFHFYSYPYEGAPEFKKTVKDNDVIYTLKDEMRDKEPEMMWNFEYKTSPHIRYKVTSKDEKPNSETDAEKVLELFNYNPTDIGVMVDFMEGNFKKEKDGKKIAYELYYMLRNPIYRKAFFNVEQGEPLENSYTPELFFLLADKYLNKYKISHDIMIVPSRRFGPFPLLVNLSSCDFLIRVNTTPPVYIPRPTAFTLPDEVPYYLEGTEAVTNVVSKNNTLAVTTADQNATITSMQVSLDTKELSKLNVKRSVVAKGHTKDYHQYLVFTNYDYLKEYDLPKYQVQRSGLMRDIIKQYNKEKIKFEQRLTQDYTERDKRIKDYLEKEMDVKISDYKNLSVKSIGMWHTAPNAEYSDEMILENVTKKAGPNLIIEVGKLIEKQIELKEEEKKRSRDIYMDFPRSFVHEIAFTVPDGYRVEGYENFNKKTENETGGFVSSAELNGKVLLIKTKKYYTNNYYKVADWPKITSFLTSSVDFYNSKLLLKKVAQ